MLESMGSTTSSPDTTIPKPADSLMPMYWYPRGKEFLATIHSPIAKTTQ